MSNICGDKITKEKKILNEAEKLTRKKFRDLYCFKKENKTRERIFYGIGSCCGNYDVTPEIYYDFIVNGEDGTSMLLTENKTEYFRFVVDVDLKPKYNIEEGQYEQFGNNIVKCIDKSVRFYIYDNKNLGYVVSNKNNKMNKIHINYPDLIVNSEIAQCIRLYALDLLYKLSYKLSEEDWNEIYDLSVSQYNAVRPLFVRKEGETKGYEIDFKKSTYKDIPKDKYNQLVLTIVSTNAKQVNFNRKYDNDVDLLQNDIDMYKAKGLIKIKRDSSQNKRDVPKKISNDKTIKTKIDQRNDYVTAMPECNKIFVDMLLENMKDKRFDDYKSWSVIMQVLKNYGLRNLAHKHSKRIIDKYDKGKLDDFFNNDIWQPTYTIKLLIGYSLEDNYKKHKLIMAIHKAPLFYANLYDILLHIMPDLQESSDFITDNAFNEMCKHSTIIQHSGTGTGKTKRINQYIELHPESRIISIVNQIALAKCHEKAFEENNFWCYLNNTEVNDKQRCIVTLESLCKVVDDEYDVVILDELTTTLLDIESPTMSGKRKQTIELFMKLIKKAKNVIISDAIITDAVIEFIKPLRENIFYYRNTSQRSRDTILEIYDTSENDSNKKILSFINPIIEKIKMKNSCCIMSDSKKYIQYVGKYLSQFAVDFQIKIYDSDEGDNDEIYDCNNAWKYKVVCFSPKVTHGIDVQIEYEKECVYAIYSCKSISSFYMLQQIGRIRKCKNIKVLWLQKNYRKLSNHYITFEEMTNRIVKKFDEYTKTIKQINNKMEIVSELCSRYDKNHELKFDIEGYSPYVKTYLYHAYYNYLFRTNKSQLFIDLAKRQGYQIVYKELKIIDKINEIEKFDVNEYEKEVNETYKNKILDYLNDKLDEDDDQYKKIEKHINDITESIGITKECIDTDNELKLAISDKKITDSWFKNKILFYDDERIKDKYKTKYENNRVDSYAIYDMKTDNIQSVIALKKVEKIVGLRKRFDIDNINYVGTEIMQIIDKLKENIDDVIKVYYKNNTKGSREVNRMILNRIDKIKTKNDLQKFMADCYNKFDKLFELKRKSGIRHNNDREYIYDIWMSDRLKIFNKFSNYMKRN